MDGRWPRSSRRPQNREPGGKQSDRATEHLRRESERFSPAASYSPATRALVSSFKLKPRWRQEESSLGRPLPVQKAFSPKGSGRAPPPLRCTNTTLCQEESQQWSRGDGAAAGANGGTGSAHAPSSPPGEPLCAANARLPPWNLVPASWAETASSRYSLIWVRVAKKRKGSVVGDRAQHF